MKFGVTMLAAVLLAGTPPAVAGERPEEAPGQWEMTTYQLVLLWRGENTTPIGERGIQRLQEEHLAWMARLLDQGKLVAGGPVGRGGDLRRVLLLDLPTPEEARAVVSEDSWVRAGRMRAEVHAVWAAGNVLRRPANTVRLERCTLGLFRRPEGAPAYDRERIQEIQAGHMANLESMAATGDLVLAGPVQDDGPLRGFLLFRTLDMERLRGLLAGDPAVKAGRLGVELYPWNVPRGTLPPP